MFDEMLQAIQSNPQDYDAWMRMAVAVGMSGDGAGLTQLLLYRNSLGLSGVELAYDMSCALIANGQQERFVSLAATIAEDNPFSGAFLVGRAYGEFLSFRLDVGVRWLREGFRRLLVLKQTCPTETLRFDDIGTLAGSAFLFETSDWIPASMLAKRPLELRLEAVTVGQGFGCVAFADTTYFLRYASRFLNSLRQYGTAEASVYLGIVNPTDESLALARSLAQNDGRLTILGVEYEGDYLPEFCSAARLVYGADMLAQLGKPLLFFDLDAEFPDGAARMLRTISAHPLACIRTTQFLPQLIIDASVIGAHPGERTTKFFRQTENYILGKLMEKGPLWTFDQVALYRAVSAFYEADAPVVDIAECGGADKRLPGYFKSDHVVSLGRRQTMRSNARMALAQVTEDGRPIFTEVGGGA